MILLPKGLSPNTDYEYQLSISYYETWTDPLTGQAHRLLRNRTSQIQTFRTGAF